MDIEKIKQNKSVQELLEFGIVNINKPSGPTSFNVSDFIRNQLNARKTSHFGTLDPKVTGVLPIAINRGCKLTGFFLGEDKEYVGIMKIHRVLPLKEIKKKIKENFTGKIMQLPPKKSRVKRQLREREIKNFEIIEKGEKNILFRVACQGGTYVRKLIYDLGESLGIGAHMLELRRIRAGIFNEKDEKYPSINLYEFEKIVEDYKNGNDANLKKILIPGEIITELYPIIQIKKEFVNKILKGCPIYSEHLERKRDEKNIGKFCAFHEERFIGIYRIIKEGGVFARPEFVFQSCD